MSLNSQIMIMIMISNVIEPRVREMISYNVKEVFIHKEEDNKVGININIHKINYRENMNNLLRVPLEMA